MRISLNVFTIHYTCCKLTTKSNKEDCNTFQNGNDNENNTLKQHKIKAQLLAKADLKKR